VNVSSVRIAIYCPHYEDPGGVGEVTRRLARRFVDVGDRVVLLARARHPGLGPLPDVDSASGALVWRTRIAPAPLRAGGWRATRQFLRRFPTGAWSMIRRIRAERPEIVATHCSKRHAPWVLALRAGVGVPVVVHLHNAAHTADGPESPQLTRLLLRCATRVIAVSEPVAAYARSMLPSHADRVVCIPNGAEPGEFADMPPATRARPYVVGVGRLAAQKGFDVLLPAFAAAGGDVDLVLAGDGPDREALAADAARLLSLIKI
jgi:glycosyltransferase involved in cell wall biosynthesis